MPELDMQKLVSEFRPANVSEYAIEDVLERGQVSVSTVKWWQKAHEEKTNYHEQFPGYCVVCIYS